MAVYSVGKWAAIIQRYTHQYIDKRFNHFGLGNTEVLVLLTLYDQENVPQDYITRQIVMDKATITRAIKRLEEKGYLYRKESVSDRRKKIVFLTEAAWKIEEEITEAMRYDKRIHKRRKTNAFQAPGKSGEWGEGRSGAKVECL